MEQIISYIDANLIIDAVSKEYTDQKLRALAILNDPQKFFITSDYVWLEVMPKMRYQKMDEQLRLTEIYFQYAEFVPSGNVVIKKAKKLAADYGLAAMDALHASCAIVGGADELITCEKPTKPFFRIPPNVLKVVSLYEL